MSSQFADQGTAAHSVLEQCLQMTYGIGLIAHARDFIGQSIDLPADEKGDHARLSPSAAKRWMTCPASVAMCEKYQEDPSPRRSVVFTSDDAYAVQQCLDFVAEKRQQLIDQGFGPVVVRTERKTHLRRWIDRDDCDGTSDIVLVGNGILVHIDYKHGAGTPVSVDDPQNELYALGTLADYAAQDGSVPFQHVEMVIAQPRCEKVSPRIRQRRVDVATWMPDILTRLRDALSAIDAPDASETFVPSEEGCRWCNVGGAARYTGAPICSRYADLALSQYGIPMQNGEPLDITGATSIDPNVLSTGRIVEILDGADLLRGMLAAVESHARNELLKTPPNEELRRHYKLIRGRTNVRWAIEDRAELVKRLKRVIKVTDPETQKTRAPKKGELFEESLRSPAKIRDWVKTLKLTETQEAAFKELLVKPEGALTLAPATSSKPEAELPRDQSRPTAEEAFAGLSPQL